MKQLFLIEREERTDWFITSDLFLLKADCYVMKWRQGMQANYRNNSAECVSHLAS